MKNFKKFILIVFVLSIIILPVLSFAQSDTVTVCSTTTNNIGDILCKIGSTLKSVIPVLVTLGVVYFIWGVVSYVISSEEEAKKAGKDRMIYGLIGLVVIFAMWGIVYIVTNTFGFDQPGNVASDFIQNTNTILGSNASGSSCDVVTNPKLGDLLNYGTCILIKSVVPLIIGLAMAMFMWGVVQYVINSDEEAKKEKGKQFMIWGIIGLAVMISVWGLVRIVGTTFRIDYAIPQVKQQ